MTLPMILSLAIFVTCCVLIVYEKVNKIVIAFTGAVIFLVLIPILSQKYLIIGDFPALAFSDFIDWNVIFLLIGIMLMVGVLKKTGIFEYIAIYLAKLAKGNPKYILLLLFFITGVLSSFIDAVAVIIIMTQISILIAVELRISPLPFVITQLIASSLGGAGTLIGDPPNIMVGSTAGFTFMDFIKNLFLFAMFNLFVAACILYFIFRKDLVVSNARRARIMEFKEKELIHDKHLLVYSCFVFSIFLILLLLQDFFHEVVHLELEASTIALFTAILMIMKVKKDDLEKFISNEIEWGTILFFIFLFIMVGALRYTGFIELVSLKILELTNGNFKLMSGAIVWVAGIGSAVFNNIPFTAAMIPMIENLSNNPEVLKPLWWALALGACFGGNGTLIATSTNLIAVDICKKSNFPISFMTFTKYGALITIINLILSTVFILIVYY